jgi:hypothetical protein
MHGITGTLERGNGEIMNKSYAVIDDFLAPDDHAALWDAFQQTALTPTATSAWNRAYRLMDGDEPANSTSALRHPSLQDGAADAPPAPPVLRRFSETLLKALTGEPPLIAMPSWTGFTQSAWVYRRDMGLEWHSDTGWLAGYIYYVHPEWRAAWGGELLVATDDGAAVSPGETRSAVDAVCQSGGVFIHPRPNRLVLLLGGTLHCIKKVESNALRASVSGFFFNTEAMTSDSRPSSSSGE